MANKPTFNSQTPCYTYRIHKLNCQQQRLSTQDTLKPEGKLNSFIAPGILIFETRTPKRTIIIKTSNVQCSIPRRFLFLFLYHRLCWLLCLHTKFPWLIGPLCSWRFQRFLQRREKTLVRSGRVEKRDATRVKWMGNKCMRVSIVMGLPRSGWFISWKTPNKNG